MRHGKRQREEDPYPNDRRSHDKHYQSIEFRKIREIAQPQIRKFKTNTPRKELLVATSEGTPHPFAVSDLAKRTENFPVNNLSEKSVKNAAHKIVKQREVLENERRQRKIGRRATIAEYDADIDIDPRPVKRTRVDQVPTLARLSSPNTRSSVSLVLKRLSSAATAANSTYYSIYPPGKIDDIHAEDFRQGEWRQNNNDSLMSSPSYQEGTGYIHGGCSAGASPSGVELPSMRNVLGYVPLPPHGDAYVYTTPTEQSNSCGQPQFYNSQGDWTTNRPATSYHATAQPHVAYKNNDIPSSSAPTANNINNLSSPSSTISPLTTPHGSSPPQLPSQKAKIVEIISISSDEASPTAERQKQTAHHKGGFEPRQEEEVDIYNPSDQYYSRHEYNAPKKHTYGNSVTRHYRERMGLNYSHDLLVSCDLQLTAYVRLDENVRQKKAELNEIEADLKEKKVFQRWTNMEKSNEYFKTTAAAQRHEKAQLLSDIDALKQEKLRAETDLEMIERQEPAHMQQNRLLKEKMRILRDENADLRRRLGLIATEVVEEREAEWASVRNMADWEEVRDEWVQQGGAESESGYDFEAEDEKV